MSKLVPDPNAPQIRQALEQGLRGISKTAVFTAFHEVFAQPLAGINITFPTPVHTVTKITPFNKNAVFVASAPFVAVTRDCLKTAMFVAVGTAAKVTAPFTITKTPAFTAVAFVQQI